MRKSGIRFATLGSGSSGNVTWVETRDLKILIDAGLSAREIERRLATIGHSLEEVDLVLLSHEHDDHSRGLEQLTRRHPVAVAASRGTLAMVAERLDSRCERVELSPERPRRLSGLEVTGIPLAHDAQEPMGFRLAIGEDVFAHATDFGHVHQGLRDAFMDATALLIESNHDIDLVKHGPYPWSLKRRVLGDLGHLSNEALALFLERTPLPHLKLLCLAHLSRVNNRPALAQAVAVRALGARSESITVRLAPPDRAVACEATTAGPPRDPRLMPPTQLHLPFFDRVADAPPQRRLTSNHDGLAPAALPARREEL